MSSSKSSSSFDGSALVLGPALVRYGDRIPASVRVADPALWWPRAAGVIELGVRQFRAGSCPPYWPLEPVYMRPSAAEEKRGGSVPSTGSGT